MKLWNRNPESLQFARLVNRIPPRRSNATLIVKATYKLVPDGVAKPLRPAEDPPPPVDTTPPEGRPDLPSGDLPVGGETPPGEIPAELIGYSSDFVPFKPRGEVLVTGTAHAPDGRPVRGLEVKIQAGPVRKGLWVIGDHAWADGRKTDIRPFTAMPLGWDRAYGGAGFARNPAGKGFAAVTGETGVRYRPMPNLHRPDKMVDDPHIAAEPVGLGPIPAGWPQRSKGRMGTYDEAWLKSRWPWFPADFDWGHFNAAPADQQIDGYWRGDEALAFLNMHPRHALYRSRLPALRARCFWKESLADRPDEAAEDPDATWPAGREDADATLPGGQRPGSAPGPDETVALPPDAADPPGQADGTLVASLEATLRQVRRSDDAAAPAGDDPGETLPLNGDPDATLFDSDDPDTTMLTGAEGPPEAAAAPAPAPSEPPAADAVAPQDVDPKSLPDPAALAAALGRPRMEQSPPPAPTPEEEPADAPFLWREARLVLDTVVVDMNAEKLVLIWRGNAEFRSLKQREIGDVLVMTEPLDAPAHPPEHYLALLEQQKAALAALFEAPEDEAAVPLDKLEAYVDAEIAKGKADLDKAQAAAEAHKAGHPTVAPGDPPPPPSAPPGDAEIDVMAAEAGGGDPARTDRVRAELEAASAATPPGDGPAAQEAAKQKAELDQAEADTKARIAAAMAPHFGKIDGPSFDTTEEFLRAARRGDDLRAADFAGLDLSNLDLTGFDLTNANFFRARLDGARLQAAKLTGANFAMASARETDFRGATLNSCGFFKAELKGARFAGASIAMADFGGRDLSGSDFSGCSGDGAVFLKAKLTGAIFRNADLPRAIFHEADLDHADFSEARLDKAHMVGASARWIVLRNARMPNFRAMEKADFTAARAQGLVAPNGNWTQAKLQRANLRDADLTGSLLNEIDAEEADFDRAILTGCDFQEARLVRARMTNANLLRAGLDRTDLTDCDLSGSNLYRAFVHEAVLHRTVVVDTNLKGTLLEDHA